MAKELESKSSVEGPKNEENKSHEGILVEKKSQIQGTLKYLMANQENLDASQKEFLKKFSLSDESKPEAHKSIGNIDPLHKL